MKIYVIFLSFVSLAGAAEMKDYAGTWAMRIGARNLFVLNLTADGESLRGTFERPSHLSSNNFIFSNIRGGARLDKIVRLRQSPEDGALHFTVQNSTDAQDEDQYRLQILHSRGQLFIDDLPPGITAEPMMFDRTSPDARVSVDWEQNRTYIQGDSDVANAEMKTIFEEDQRVRQSGEIDWKVVERSDGERRQRTAALLAAGALHTGMDFLEAAFVFQHGSTSEDYLLAHTLAMVAISKGTPTAIWIASATLDRYLQNIGQGQIFGTQYGNQAGVWSQDPYDRKLISDALRRQLGVPSQASQAKQLESYKSGH